MTRKICVITGSRAEYGLLRWVMQGVKDDPELTLQMVATGMHLSPRFGLTYQEIESDGFDIDRKVEMLTESDTPVGVAKSMGNAMIGFADALDELRPDIIVVLGDRFEILSAALAANVMGLPIAHIGGGDVGRGTYDNNFRHCISKLSSLHFVTNEDSKLRVIQLGEDPTYVFNFGSTAVDNFQLLRILSKDELQNSLNLKFEDDVLLMTFHPLSANPGTSLKQLAEILNAIETLRHSRKFTLILTNANADSEGMGINEVLRQYAKISTDTYFFDDLGQVRYLSIMKLAKVVIGNSSSGIYEAAYCMTPTVNIGNRQEGRTAPASVIHCPAKSEEVVASIEQALKFKMVGIDMVYGSGNTSTQIVKVLKKQILQRINIDKKFYDFGRS